MTCFEKILSKEKVWQFISFEIQRSLVQSIYAQTGLKAFFFFFSSCHRVKFCFQSEACYTGVSIHEAIESL